MALDGIWNIVISTPMGERKGTANLAIAGDRLTGTMTNEFGDTVIEDGEVEETHLFWRTRMTQPMPMTLEFELDLVDDRLVGSAQFGPMGEAPVTATRA